MISEVRKKAEKRSTEIIIFAVILAAGTAATTYNNTNILDAGTSSSDGLVAEYRFDTGAGNTAYDTSGNNDGTIKGASWASGLEGEALSFDGDNDYAVTDNDFPVSGTDARTVSVWYKTSKDSTWFQNNEEWASLVDFPERESQEGSFMLAVSSNECNVNAIAIHMWGTNTCSGKTVEDVGLNEWHHLVGVMTGNGEQRIYIDGELEGTSNFNPDTPKGPVQIGRRSHSSKHYFSGELDNVRIYSQELNKSQVRSLYNRGSWRIGTTTKEDDPSKVLDISFQHQNDTHVYDTSGYENHGTRENGVGQASSVDCKVGRCYSFDGNNDYVNIGDRSVSSQNGITVMGWFRNPSGSRWISRDRSDYWNLGDYGWEVSDGSISDINDGGWTSAIREDEWTHVAAIFNPDTGFQAVYLNGKLQASQTLSSFGEIGIGTSRDVTLGCNVENDGRGSYPDGCYSVKYSGKMDQIKVFNRSLSQSEIVEKTQGLDSGGAVLDLRFNRDGGDLAEDSSGRNNHGRLEPNEETGPKRTGGSLRFDGLDDRVEIPDGGTLDYTGGGLGLSVWFRENDSGNGRLISKPWNGEGDYNYRLDLQGNNKIKFRLEGNDDNIHSIVSDPVRSEVTQHIFAVEDDGRMALYLNGDKVAEESHDIDTWTPSDGDGNRNLAVGTLFPYENSWSGDKGFSFEGEILKVERKNYVPSSKRIEQIYQSGVQNQQRSISEPRTEPVLSHTFDHIETCGKSDTITCPSGASGEIAVDESGEANHGELVNGPSVKGAEDCRVGGCLGFDGSDDYLEANHKDNLNVTDDISIAAWFKTPRNTSRSTDDGDNPIAIKSSCSGGYGDCGAGYHFNHYREQLWFVISDNPVSANVGDISDQWNFFVGTYDGGNVNIYHQGELLKSSNIGSEKIFNDNPLWIGRTNRWGEIKYEGILDQVRVYNRSLSDQEVWKLYTRGRDRETGMAGPVAHYPIQVESSPLRDISGEGNHGELNLLGESGAFNTSDGEWRTVRFERSYEDPVVVGTTNTHSGEAAIYFEVRDVDSGSAEMRLCESEGGNTDGCDTHGTERAGYIVVDSASTDDIPGIEAGSFSTSDGGASFSESFSTPPIVFSQPQTDNSEGEVVSWTTYRDTSGFNVQVCDQDSTNGCTSPDEEIGWIAVEPGNEPFEQAGEADTLGSEIGSSNWGTANFASSFSKRPVGVFSVQNNDGGQDPKVDEIRNVGTDSMEMRFCELETGDTCDGHASMEYAYLAVEEGLLTYSNGNFPRYVDDSERGKALKFDGSDDYIETSSEIEFGSSTWTVTSWYYPEASDDYGHIFTSSSDQGNFATKISKDLVPYFYSDDGRTYSGNANESLVLDEWQHLSYVYDGSSISIFLDGALIADGSVSGLDIPPDSYRIQGGNNEFVRARHDDVRIYPYALNSEQVKKVMNSGAASIG